MHRNGSRIGFVLVFYHDSWSLSIPTVLREPIFIQVRCWPSTCVHLPLNPIATTREALSDFERSDRGVDDCHSIRLSITEKTSSSVFCQIGRKCSPNSGFQIIHFPNILFISSLALSVRNCSSSLALRLRSPSRLLSSYSLSRLAWVLAFSSRSILSQ